MQWSISSGSDGHPSSSMWGRLAHRLKTNLAGDTITLQVMDILINNLHYRRLTHDWEFHFQTGCSRVTLPRHQSPGGRPRGRQYIPPGQGDNPLTRPPRQALPCAAMEHGWWASAESLSWTLRADLGRTVLGVTGGSCRQASIPSMAGG